VQVTSDANLLFLT